LWKIESTSVLDLYAKTSMHSWSSFKDAFKDYIMITVGIFTLYEGSNFRYFDLGQFLNRQVDNVDRPLSVTHVEMLMALSCFIDIQEGADMVTPVTFGHRVSLQLKTLMERDLVRLSPFSEVRKALKNYMARDMNAPVCASAA
jgi:hypothetical protein